jgi:hypothetical protein
MALSLITSYFVQQNTTAGTAISTPSFTPANGEVIVVKLGTWTTGTAMGIPVGGGQTYTSRVINAPGSFNSWCGIYTAVISGSPGAMTVSSTPAASARYSMTVERWSGAQLAASPVTNSLASTGAAASTITPAQGTSVISWCSADAQSIDPATRAYLASGTDEGVRDGHSGANGVEYYGYQNASGTGSQSYGLSLPAGQTFVIAGIEIQVTAGGAVTATAQPIVVTGPSTRSDARAILTRNTAALITPAALAMPVLVVRSDVRPAAPYAALLRNDLTDPPVLTTPGPLVVGRPGTVSPPYAALLRSSLVDVAPPATSTPQPYIVSRPGIVSSPYAALLRNDLADPPVLTTPGPLVVSRPAATPLPYAALLRASLADAAPAATSTPQPYVISARYPISAPSALLLFNPAAPPPPSAQPLVVRSDGVLSRPLAALLRNPLVPFVAPNNTPAPQLFVVTRPGITSQPLVIVFGTSQLGGPFVPPIVPPITPPAAVTGDWWSLVSIERENRVIAAQAQPTACPNDGEPLRLSADGYYFCQYDGFVLGDVPVRRHAQGQDWGGLTGLINSVIADSTEDIGRRVLACPNDGEPLSRAADGTLFCEFDNWRPDQHRS